MELFSYTWSKNHWSESKSQTKFKEFYATLTPLRHAVDIEHLQWLCCNPNHCIIFRWELCLKYIFLKHFIPNTGSVFCKMQVMHVFLVQIVRLSSIIMIVFVFICFRPAKISCSCVFLFLILVIASAHLPGVTVGLDNED